MSAIEATRGDQSSGCHIYSLTAFWCPLAAESRVCSHHRFVRSSPDSGGGFSDSPLDSQSMGSAIFYALDSGRGLCHPGRSPAAGPGLPRALPSQHFALWADFKISRVCVCVRACVSYLYCAVIDIFIFKVITDGFHHFLLALLPRLPSKDEEHYHWSGHLQWHECLHVSF